jgi:hypothetical protein
MAAITVSRIRYAVGFVLWTILAGVCAFAFYDRYWLWRDCFNELGRCYDPARQQVLLANAGYIWGGLAVLCLVLALLNIWRARRR